MPIIYSTLTRGTQYNIYKKHSDGRNEVLHKIAINGGANVSVGRAFFTPRGAATTVTDEEAELLKQDVHFQEHMKNGHVKIDDKQEIEKAVCDLNSRDGSSPKVPQDYELAGEKPPVVNTAEEVQKVKNRKN